jgi:hypothetical protein
MMMVVKDRLQLDEVQWTAQGLRDHCNAMTAISMRWNDRVYTALRLVRKVSHSSEVDRLCSSLNALCSLMD